MQLIKGAVLVRRGNAVPFKCVRAATILFNLLVCGSRRFVILKHDLAPAFFVDLVEPGKPTGWVAEHHLRGVVDVIFFNLFEVGDRRSCITCKNHNRERKMPCEDKGGNLRLN